jgi:amino acid adenylation domain-containing protein
LKLDKAAISVESSFFELGGNSLRLVFLANKLKQVFQKEFSLARIIELQNIVSLAKAVQATATDGFESIMPAPLKPHYELSSVQKRFYFLNEFDKASLAYNMPEVAKLEGTVDKEKVQDTFRKLILRHESLRTEIVNIDGRAVQRVKNDAPFSIEYFEADEQEASDILKAFIRPFDLSSAPLIRVGLIRLSGEIHLLAVDMHHIITDGVSQGILIKDFMTLYNQQPLPEVKLHYKDFAEWQQTFAQRKRLASQQEFWVQEFSDELSVLEIPTDFSRPITKSFKGDNKSFLLGKEETMKLKALGEKTDATLFMTVLSVFNILLSKLSNQEQITIGTPVAGRDHADLEDIIGVFLNALPIRNYPKGELSFKTFLTEVKAKTLSCFDNLSYQYEDLMEVLDMPRDISRNPLFDVMLVVQNYDQEALTIPGLKLTPYEYNHQISKLDLTLTAIEFEEGLYFNFEYSTELFAAQTIDRLIQYFKNIVTEVVTEPNKKLSHINMIGEEEVHKLLHDFNNTTLDYPRDKTLVDLFEEQVRQHPDKPAVAFNGEVLTYKELNEKSNQFAHYLLKTGIVPGSVVGLLLDRSLEMMVSIIGILKAGSAYLPIDPATPEQRIAYILKQSNATLLLTNGLYTTGTFQVPVKAIETLQLDRININAVQINIKPTDTAYCIFTSGSTGLPKGVMMAHGSVVNLVKGLNEKVYTAHDNESLRVALLASYSFDASVQQIFGALLQGHALHICDDLARKDGRLLIEFYNQNKINLSDGTPTHLRLLVNALDGEITLNTLQSWILAGEVLTKEVVKEFYKKKGDTNVTLYNFYGPTETCVDSTSFKIEMEQLDSYTTVPIGRPLPNERIYIADQYGNLVPIGVVGELCIAGDGVAQGYVGDDVLTATKFAINWVSGERRVYRTGDLARWLPDGNIEYLGRMDHQVKIRGYRVELGEIEKQLMTHDSVRNAVVQVREVKSEQSVIGYYVSDAPIKVSTLRKHLSQLLPDYMIPSYFVYLEKIILTTSGKINYKALPDVEMSMDDGYKAPADEVENQLVNIWSEVLKMDRKSISVDGNFFELGGHSLKAIQIVNSIAKHFEVKIKLVDFFENPSIQQQAKLININQWLNDENKPEEHLSAKTEIII